MELLYSFYSSTNLPNYLLRSFFLSHKEIPKIISLFHQPTRFANDLHKSIRLKIATLFAKYVAPKIAENSTRPSSQAKLLQQLLLDTPTWSRLKSLIPSRRFIFKVIQEQRGRSLLHQPERQLLLLQLLMSVPEPLAPSLLQLEAVQIRPVALVLVLILALEVIVGAIRRALDILDPGAVALPLPADVKHELLLGGGWYSLRDRREAGRRELRADRRTVLPSPPGVAVVALVRSSAAGFIHHETFTHSLT